VDWLLQNYKWLFDGIGGVIVVALFGYAAKRLLGSKPKPAGQTTAKLTAKGAKVTDSPVASGSGINQMVNSPTVNLNLGSASEGIHGRQVDALLAINAKLEAALSKLQRATSSARFSGQAPDQELLYRASRDLAEASAEFSQKKLLISVVLTRKIDEFFMKVVSAGMTLNVALDPMTPNGETRAKFWGEARDIANKELPLVLQAIQAEARAVIHGPSSQ
jgi:hypothetical protein